MNIVMPPTYGTGAVAGIKAGYGRHMAGGSHQDDVEMLRAVHAEGDDRLDVSRLRWPGDEDHVGALLEGGAAADAGFGGVEYLFPYDFSVTDIRQRLDDYGLEQVLFNLPAGPVGFLAGAEYREESFTDDRDPRLDGTIAYTAYEGATFPIVSDVANSSPTADNSGERDVTSLFVEFAVPVFETLDLQAALRYENFSDFGSTLNGKLATRFRINDSLALRAAISTGFHAPTPGQSNVSTIITTFDGTTVAWYGDGVLIGSQDIPASGVQPTGAVHVGKRQDNDNYFAGSVDEVRIYSIGLSAGEIAALGGRTGPVHVPF